MSCLLFRINHLYQQKSYTAQIGFSLFGLRDPMLLLCLDLSMVTMEMTYFGLDLQTSQKGRGETGLLNSLKALWGDRTPKAANILIEMPEWHVASAWDGKTWARQIVLAFTVVLTPAHHCYDCAVLQSMTLWFPRATAFIACADGLNILKHT